ncbi:sigma 54-interacting transcriptional regulator [Sorangium cellulosum]|uniref:Acetoacetate metabolism regulatory protein AtoC n=1 Tax=Sorangium cellulosum So0157-2 TaxID=1254432 RepID=S4XNL9_SORCE|nr:sigma 54-interacting transcriptional regulator [Sorangium cellulosum]AGP32258.1 acetoacetate metabolism regulatory protein AtoC [Sorangium cellulosum So0157-2]
MSSILVVIPGELGRTVARALRALRSLEDGLPPLDVALIEPGDLAASPPAADLVIVDGPLPAGAQGALGEGTPVLALGREAKEPFAPGPLRDAVLAAVERAEFGGIVAVDPPLRAALRVIEIAAPRRAGVLVTGPTGVGKELLAQRLHRRSGRPGAFVAINCAALTDGLVESTLFGHVRGAFTGAVSTVPGAFVEAQQGTLFLDEFGDLAPAIQAKLLRALEYGEVRPVGGARTTSVDVRVVAATNRDLMREVERSRFRADLYYRLATFVIDIPPLCDRPRDLAALARKLSAEHERSGAVTLSGEAEHLLLAYPWPGNVRELRNVIERVLSLARDGAVGVEELLRLAPELSAVRQRDAAGGTLADVERRRILEVLRDGGARGQVADALGIHRTTLWRRLKRMSAPGDSAPPPSGEQARGDGAPDTPPPRSRRRLT